MEIDILPDSYWKKPQFMIAQLYSHFEHRSSKNETINRRRKFSFVVGVVRRPGSNYSIYCRRVVKSCQSSLGRRNKKIFSNDERRLG